MTGPEMRDRSLADRCAGLFRDFLWILASTILIVVGLSFAAIAAGLALTLAGVHVSHRTLAFVFAALLAVIDVLVIGGYARRRANRDR
jgi:hypothetical protein